MKKKKGGGGERRVVWDRVSKLGQRLVVIEGETRESGTELE
jgi:sporulation protein YlmC with PRC-barrel domain